MYVFFFSSRRRHTRSLCDWSSDVCSSDLLRRVSALDLKGSLFVGEGRTRDGRLIQFLQVDEVAHLDQIGRASCRERVKIPVRRLRGKLKKAVKRCVTSRRVVILKWND